MHYDYDDLLRATGSSEDDDTEAHVVMDGSDSPECVDDCPGCDERRKRYATEIQKQGFALTIEERNAYVDAAIAVADAEMRELRYGLDRMKADRDKWKAGAETRPTRASVLRDAEKAIHEHAEAQLLRGHHYNGIQSASLVVSKLIDAVEQGESW